MTKLLALCLLIAVTSSWLTTTVVGQSAVQKARNRTVYLETPDSSCTGVVLRTDLVLTCSHCIEKNRGIKVDGKPGRVIKNDPKADLALISVGTIMVDSIYVADISASDEVFTWGYPLSSPNAVFAKGNISVIQFGRVFSSLPAIPGASGSGIFNPSGELVGIMQAHSSTGLAVTIEPETIRKFLD